MAWASRPSAIAERSSANAAAARHGMLGHDAQATLVASPVFRGMRKRNCAGRGRINSSRLCFSCVRCLSTSKSPANVYFTRGQAIRRWNFRRIACQSCCPTAQKGCNVATKTTTKSTTKKQSVPAPRAALPSGVKVSTLRLHPATRRMIRHDRGVASGGRNLVQRQSSAR